MLPAPNGFQIHPKMFNKNTQTYCIIFGQPLQENKSFLAVIFVLFLRKEDDHVD